MTPHLFLHRPARRIALLAASILVTPISVLAAQQTCLPAPDVARYMVSVFLTDSAELTQRQAFGITATRVEDLRPLADVPDAPLCRRMDSTVTPHPVFYFWAGRYIIATNAVPHTDTLASINEGTALVFLFDTTGRFVYTKGARRPTIAPMDLRSITPVGGPVKLAWTNSSSNAVRYQVQRALGNGGFASVGPALLGSATTATDSTALANPVSIPPRRRGTGRRQHVFERAKCKRGGSGPSDANDDGTPVQGRLQPRGRRTRCQLGGEGGTALPDSRQQGASAGRPDIRRR